MRHRVQGLVGVKPEERGVVADQERSFAQVFGVRGEVSLHAGKPGCRGDEQGRVAPVKAIARDELERQPRSLGRTERAPEAGGAEVGSLQHIAIDPQLPFIAQRNIITGRIGTDEYLEEDLGGGASGEHHGDDFARVRGVLGHRPPLERHDFGRGVRAPEQTALQPPAQRLVVGPRASGDFHHGGP